MPSLSARKVILAAFVGLLAQFAVVPVAVVGATKAPPGTSAFSPVNPSRTAASSARPHLETVESIGAPRHWIALTGTNLDHVSSVRFYDGDGIWISKRFRSAASNRGVVTAYFPPLSPGSGCAIRVTTSAGLSNALTFDVVVRTSPNAPAPLSTSKGPPAPAIIVVTDATVVVVQSVSHGSAPPPPSPPPTGTSSLPTLLVISTSWSPPAPSVGDLVTFSAVVANIGSAPTPSGIELSFSVDGTKVSWVDSGSNGQLPAGTFETLTADDGPMGSPTWMAASGTHTVVAHANVDQAFSEASDAGDVMSATLMTTSSPATATVSSTSSF